MLPFIVDCDTRSTMDNRNVRFQPPSSKRSRPVSKAGQSPPKNSSGRRMVSGHASYHPAVPSYTTPYRAIPQTRARARTNTQTQ